MTTAALALWLQLGLLSGYGLLSLLALAALARPRWRPAAIATAFLAVPHAVYYALFLVWPDALSAQETMLFSILLRYQALFVTLFMLILLARATGATWKR